MTKEEFNDYMDRYPCGMFDKESARDILGRWNCIPDVDGADMIEYLLKAGYLIPRVFYKDDNSTYWIVHPNESDSKEYGGLTSEV